jgi:hypothetical protein
MSDSDQSSSGKIPSTRSRTASRTQEFFKEKEARKTTIYQQMETERVISDTKTAKLRALRLAKEEADRLAAPPKGKKK